MDDVECVLDVAIVEHAYAKALIKKVRLKDGTEEWRSIDLIEDPRYKRRKDDANKKSGAATG